MCGHHLSTAQVCLLLRQVCICIGVHLCMRAYMWVCAAVCMGVCLCVHVRLCGHVRTWCVNLFVSVYVGTCV